MLGASTLQHEEEGEHHNSSIKYSSRMHPITKIKIPDFMDRDRSSMVDAACTIIYAAIPMSLNYLLNYGSGLISIYFISLDFPSPTFAYIVFGTVLANLFVFHIIEYVAAGFSIICSYFSSQEKEEIGLLYQKTLGITFLICVIMTPIIFIMDKILGLFGYDYTVIGYACSYTWAIVPSFYLYSFIDTNKNYLHSQGVIFPPIVIHLFAVMAHLIILSIYHFTEPLGLLGVAWVKNITDMFCALALYFYIIIKEPTKESWIQWSLKSTNNINRFLKEVMHHQSFTYTELVCFQVLCVVASHTSIAEMTAHYTYAFMYFVIYFIYISLTQCLSHSLAISIESNELNLCKKKISLGVCLSTLLSVVLIMNIIHYRSSFVHIFIDDDPQVTEEIYKVIYIFCTIIFISSMNTIMLGIVKTLELELAWDYSFAFCYFIGIIVGATLCYFFDYGLQGIWGGWLLALVAELFLNLKRLLCLDFEEAFTMIKNRYNVVVQEVRASRYELNYQDDRSP